VELCAAVTASIQVTLPHLDIVDVGDLLEQVELASQRSNHLLTGEYADNIAHAHEYYLEHSSHHAELSNGVYGRSLKNELFGVQLKVN